MKAFFIYIVFILFSSCCHGQNQDFGVAGLKGFSAEQLVNLSNGNIVFHNADNSEDRNSLIEASIVFDASPEKTWELISKTDDQPLYIQQCKSIKVINKTASKAFEVHCVGNWLATYTYGVIQNYLPEDMCVYWILDTSYSKNDLNTLGGYWQLYPYGKGKTLARFGSRVSFKNVPEFVENMFKKGGVKDALASIKNYVDSGGTYRK